MFRIFNTLASLSLFLMLAAVVLGLSIGDLYHQPSPETLHARGIHMLTGVAAALAVVFVLSVVVTYFVGTSRWCKEVAETYQLDPKHVARSTALKRRTFFWAVMGMLTVVTIGALGAASDPGTGRQGTHAMAPNHLAGALAGFAVIASIYYRAGQNIASNQQVIRQVLAQVEEIRGQRGLEDPKAVVSSSDA